jgi:hypothetical protein
VNRQRSYRADPGALDRGEVDFGGNDGARTRDLCRDSPAFWRNLLKLGAADGSFQRPETRMVTVIGPLLDPRLLP